MGTKADSGTYWAVVTQRGSYMSIWPDPGIVFPSLLLLAFSGFSGVVIRVCGIGIVPVFSEDILEVKDDIEFIERLRVVQAVRVDGLVELFP